MTTKILDIYQHENGDLTMHSYVAMSYNEYAKVMEFIAGAIVVDAEKNGIPVDYSLKKLHEIIDNAHLAVGEDTKQ